MKLSDTGEFNKLINQRKKIIGCLNDINAILEMDNPDKDGYNCCISKNSDGSGKNVDLAGCYVFYEVYEATRDILTNKLEQNTYELKQLGVDVDDEI